MQRGQSRIHVELAEDRSQARLDSQRTIVLDAAVLNVDAEEPLAVSLFVPAHVVVDAGDLDFASFRQLMAEVFFNFRAEEIESLIRHDVFQSSKFAVGSIAGIAERFDDRPRDVQHLAGSAEAHSLRDSHERLLVGRRAPLPSTDIDVVALDSLPIVNRGEAQVIRQRVDAVVFRKRDSDFELTRQVVRAVDRLDDRLKVGDVLLLAGFFVAQPEVEVRRCPRTKMLGDAIGEDLIVAADRVRVDRSRAAHDVAVHVTAGRERGQFDPIDLANRFAKVSLQHSVKLKALPCRDSQCAVAEAIAQIKLRQELFGRDFPAGHARSNHHRVGFRLARSAAVAVFLLVRAVIFEKLFHPFGEWFAWLTKLFGNGSAKLAAACLEVFDLAKLQLFGHRVAP